MIPEPRRLSDGGTLRHKVKTSLIVVGVVLVIAGLEFLRKPSGSVEDMVAIAIILGACAWSLRSTTWYVADCVEILGRRMTIRRGRQTATVDLSDITDVARGDWGAGHAVVLTFRSPVDGFGSTATYRVAGSDEIMSDEVIDSIASLRSEIGLPPSSEVRTPLTPAARRMVQIKRWALMIAGVAFMPLVVNSILDLKLFAPYDRQVIAIATLLLVLGLFRVFSPEERDELMDARRRKRR